MQQEYIICAAIHFNDGKESHAFAPTNIMTGFVVCGRRHHDCYAALQNIGKALGHEETMIVKKSIKLINREVQGFMTSTNRFVDRVEAAEIAFKAGQITELKNNLFSEDIY